MIWRGSWPWRSLPTSAATTRCGPTRPSPSGRRRACTARLNPYLGRRLCAKPDAEHRASPLARPTSVRREELLAAHRLARFCQGQHEMVGELVIERVDHPVGGAVLPPGDHVQTPASVSYTHLRAHETDSYLVCRLLL